MIILLTLFKIIKNAYQRQITFIQNKSPKIILQKVIKAASQSQLMEKRILPAISIITITAFLFFIITINTVYAAELSGIVYTKDLELAKFSLLTVNTTPAQRIILNQGTYKITLDPGTYFVRASYTAGGYTYEDNATLKIAENGAYTYDFILFSTTQLQEQEVPIIDNIIPDIQNNSMKTYFTLFMWLLALLFAIGIITAIMFLKRRKNKSLEKEEISKKQPLNSDLKSILTFLTEEGGRTTQKELRKNIPCSEAKMSMMLTELEHKGKIERIKKGRANLIVLK